MMQPNPRYQRHYDLQDFGVAAQQKLERASVLVIGAGGLGCPALLYLAGAGVGKIGIVDGDAVSLSNLHRQVLYVTADIGRPKSAVAFQRLSELNPEIEIEHFNYFITNQKAVELFPQYDLILDCTDNFAARYLINDACVLLGKPLVFGAIFRYEGQVAVFNLADESGLKTNYRDLFPIPPNQNEVEDCNHAGVLGVLPGIIGTLMANEAIKILCSLGHDLRHKLWTFNLRHYQNYTLALSPNPAAIVPKDIETFLSVDYHWLCGVGGTGIDEISPQELSVYLTSQNPLVIDVRERHESPEVDFEHVRIPLSELKKQLPNFDSESIVVFCQSGKRSLEAATLIRASLPESSKISHLKGGILALQEFAHGQNT